MVLSYRFFVAQPSCVKSLEQTIAKWDGILKLISQTWSNMVRMIQIDRDWFEYSLTEQWMIEQDTYPNWYIQVNKHSY
jgi:hypothetical protein